MPEYILTLKNKGYCLSTALVRRGYSHTLNQLRTLNTFVETFFSPDIFGLASSFFLSCVFWIRIFYRINNLTFQARTTITSKQVLVPKRGKKKYQHFLYPVNHLNQRKSPSAPLVSKEIETDFFRRRFSRSREKFPKLRTLV